MESIEVLYPLLIVGLIVPVTQWIKSKIPSFPVKAPMISIVLAIGCVWLLSLWLYPEWTQQDMITYALSVQVLSQFGFEGYDSIKS